MELEYFLLKVEKKCSKITYFCAIHMLEKRFNIKNDSLEEDILKEFFIDYDNYEKLLNDYGNVIYNKFESSIDEVYSEVCNFLDEDSDNKYLFSHRLKRIINQDPIKYLNIEDEDMRDAAIHRVEDRINVIEESLYYKQNKETLSKEIEKLKKTVQMAKIVVGIK